MLEEEALFALYAFKKNKELELDRLSKNYDDKVDIRDFKSIGYLDSLWKRRKLRALV